MTIEIPGKTPLTLEHLVLDMNGTLSLDGKIPTSVGEKLKALAHSFSIYVITADTFGTVHQETADWPVTVKKVGLQGYLDKLEFLRKLGKEATVAIGNGYNDHLMLKEAALGIVVLGMEGAHPLSILNADIVTMSIENALDLLRYPKRIAATLRT